MFRQLCLVTLCLALSCTLLPTPAFAGDQDNCSSSELPLRVSRNVSAPDNIENGRPISGSDIDYGFNIKCKTPWPSSGTTCDGGVNWTLSPASGAIPTLVPGFSDVYTLVGMPSGIGYQLLGPAGQSLPLQSNRYDTGVPIQTGNQYVPFHIRFVKLSNDIESAFYPLDFELSCSGNEWANRSEAGSTISIANNLTLITQTCDLQESDVQVQLPQVARSAFKGVGESAGSAAFNLDFQCDADADARFNISDVTNLANATNALTLLPGSTASGLGVKLKQAGNPVMLAPNQVFNAGGSQFPLRNLTTSQSLISLPFSAEYVQTASHVTAGSVMAQGMVTIAYN